MRFPVSSLLAMFIVLLSLACAGMENIDLEPTRPPSTDYAGTWEGQGTKLVIGLDGDVQIEQNTDGRQSSIQAPAQSWRDGQVTIGLGPFVTSYTIDEPPYLDRGTWRMVFDGVPLERMDDSEAPVLLDGDVIEAETQPWTEPAEPTPEEVASPPQEAQGLDPQD